MTKQEVIIRMCKMSGEVGSLVFQNKYSYDCFCGATSDDKPNGDYHYEKDIIEFIENAVHTAITNTVKVRECIAKRS
jgi:hypothetical protein